VTALASDALGKFAGQSMVFPTAIRPHRNLGKGVVTEHAFSRHGSENPAMVGSLETRRHSPPIDLGVPSQRQLEQLSPFRLVEVAPSSVARTQNPVHRNLDTVDRLSLIIELPAAKEEPVLGLRNPVVALRGPVKEHLSEVLDLRSLARRGKRSGHPHMLKGVELLLMASPTREIRKVALSRTDRCFDTKPTQGVQFLDWRRRAGATQKAAQ
jgi:hypothetical protein